jgi:hypothetical protein
MPERDLSETIKRLTPMLNDPDLINKVDQAASKTTIPSSSTTMMNADDSMMGNEDILAKPKAKLADKQLNTKQNLVGNNGMLAQIVGVIIGSPEFQKR